MHALQERSSADQFSSLADFFSIFDIRFEYDFFRMLRAFTELDMDSIQLVESLEGFGEFNFLGDKDDPSVRKPDFSEYCSTNGVSTLTIEEAFSVVGHYALEAPSQYFFHIPFGPAAEVLAPTPLLTVQCRTDLEVEGMKRPFVKLSRVVFCKYTSSIPVLLKTGS